MHENAPPLSARAPARPVTARVSESRDTFSETVFLTVTFNEFAKLALRSHEKGRRSEPREIVSYVSNYAHLRTYIDARERVVNLY